ncbi:MAG TPA: YihY/virulence factor BrkB family protein [Caulobacteraceae bacterium]|jgi:membrane protein
MLAVMLGEAVMKARPSRPPAPSRGPTEFAVADWRRVAVGGLREFGKDRIPAVAAGVTFYALLALFPAVSAFVSLYGLVADVADARRQIASLGGVLPGGALSVIGDELTRLTQTDHGALGLAFALSLGVSVWSANAGMKALIEGLNVAYEAPEARGFVGVTLLSLGLTVGAILVAVAGIALASAVPQWLGAGAAPIAAWAQWPVVLVVTVAALSALYRLGPCRPGADWRWITPGSLVAAAAWLAMSALFSWYVANFGHYNRTYGSLGAIVGFLTWIWLSLMVVLLGAELNREIEKQAAG